MFAALGSAFLDPLQIPHKILSCMVSKIPWISAKNTSIAEELVCFSVVFFFFYILDLTISKFLDKQWELDWGNENQNLYIGTLAATDKL